MARGSRGARRAGKKCSARRSGGTVPGLSPPPVRTRHRRGEARERRLEPEARPAGSERAAAGARPRRGRGKKNTLFPLGPPPRIMYQDYPGNFDTSSRGSSGSPAHAESYTSGGGQQVGAGPGCTWRRGRTPALLSSPLPLLLSFPIFGLARKFLRGHHCKFRIFVLSCPSFFPPPPPLFFFLTWSGEWAGRAVKPFSSHYILPRQAPGIAASLLRSLLTPLPEIPPSSPPSLLRGGQKNLCTHRPLPTSKDSVPVREPSLFPCSPSVVISERG